MDTSSYDLIVIGAGPVGENVADRAVAGGLTAVIVESELVGGECSYWACTPSKALLRPIAALRGARDVDGAKQAVTGGLDVAAVLRRRDHAVHDFDDSVTVTMGIPFVRTSVDHGTAFDIAGKGIANAQSRVRAIEIGAELATGTLAPVGP